MVDSVSGPVSCIIPGGIWCTDSGNGLNEDQMDRECGTRGREVEWIQRLERK
jgi:hypothetical protein